MNTETQHKTATTLTQAKRLIVKVGSSLLMQGKDGTLNTAWMATLGEDLAAARARGQDVILVSSGAIALGRGCLGLSDAPLSLEQSQAAAAAGQISLAHAWQEALNPQGMTIAQILLTLEDTEQRRRYLNARSTLNALLDLGAVPVINENDIVATEELKFGDNDRLSAIVAIITKADKLIIVTDQEGLFNADPTSTKDAQKIDYIEFDSEELTNLIEKSSSGRGMGGFSTKIMAAQMAGFSGIPTQIIPWTNEAVLDCINEVEIGTLIKPSIKKVKLKKLWIAYGLPVIGKIIIDTGAVEAINSDASLLSIGIKEIIKNFDNDEGVEIFDDQNNLIAKGISKIHSSDISNKNNEIVIHKDNLLIL